ncbi:MAG: TIGR00282 family metallophosphoesterase [Coprobacillus sp.]|nr:TIGR00282 family metallophosphoesterase [Coprobacillus sp.]
MRILFLGDIVGSLGREVVKEKVSTYVNKYGIDFVIANGENATHGKGLIYRHYQELIDAGVDCITLGNHYNSKKEIRSYIDNVDRLIRPVNLVESFPGVGTEVYEVDGVNIRVTNILGTAFMNDVLVSSPYNALMEILEDEENEKAPIHIVDYHAEATGEKIGFAYAFDGKVSAVLGTHTHVQTRDAKILPQGTGYISDVGMCGFADGALGLDVDSVNQKLLFGQKSVFLPPEEGRKMLDGVVLDIDEISGKCKEIFALEYIDQ